MNDRKSAAMKSGRSVPLKCASLLTLCLSVLFSVCAHAEDTEIYRPSRALTPYVMLLLDTSGSMSYDIDEAHPGRQRLPAMKNALNQLLTDAGDDYHVGLARYTSPGGAILYPVRRLGDQANVENAFWGATPADDFMVRPAFDNDDPSMIVSAADNNAAAVRIANISVPRGAVIRSASLVLTTDVDYVGSARLQARTALAGNVAAIPDQAGFDALEWQDAVAQSDLLPADQIRQHSAITINVTSQVSAQVQAGNWVSGNAMLFEVSAVEGSVGFYSAEGARVVRGTEGSVLDQFRPRLYVQYRVYEGNAAGSAPSTVRDALRGVVNTMPATGDTPLVGAYYETAQYMLGNSAHYGLNRGVSRWNALMRTSHLDSFVTAPTLNRRTACVVDALDDRDCGHDEIAGTPQYQSPIDGLEECTASPAIVMLTDGYPNNEVCGGDRGNRCDLEYVASQVANISRSPENPLTCDSTDLWDCGIKLSMALANPSRYGIDDHPPIPTYTIGFGGDVTSAGTAEANLLTLARGGYGENPPQDAVFGAYYSANSAEELSAAFRNIFDAVANGNNIQAATGVSVDQSNRTQHTDQLYFSLFEPSRDVLWPGNLKRYRLRAPDADHPEFSIVDVNDDPAIDDDGDFLATSRSFWSANADGRAVREGGAREHIPTNRQIFSFLDDYNDNFDNDGEEMTLLEPDLFDDDSRAETLNTLLDTSEGEEVINWLTRRDGSGPQMGAPIHAKPLLINYGFSNPARTQSIDTLFLSTNQGLLHGFNAANGEELFAFAPKELLRNQRHFTGPEGGNQIYGLDASWIAYRYDHNGNGDLRDNDDFVNLYGGMRMGGRNYYALDVSSIYGGGTPQPVLKFAITPETNTGTAESPRLPFATLGQTWSVPLLARLANECAAAQPRSACTSRVVMMFGGGYDYDSHEITGDSMPTPASDDQGAGIFLVDAQDGEPLWRAAGTTLAGGNVTVLDDMDYSVTATLRTLDVDADGFADHIYAVDLGGQVLRFDLAKNGHGQSMHQIASAKVVAQLGGSVTLTHDQYRRFYDAPALTLMRDTDGKRWTGIAVGSGYRSHPTNTETDEAFFMIKDYEPFETDAETAAADRPSPILLSDLSDATTGAVDIEEDQTEGWFMRLRGAGSSDLGEKVVGEPFVLNQNLVFATYVPPEERVYECNVRTGHMNLYQVRLRNAAGALPSGSNDGSLVRFAEEVAPGLISGVSLIQAVVNGEREELVSMGPRLIDIETDSSFAIQRTRWHSNEGENRIHAGNGAN